MPARTKSKVNVSKSASAQFQSIKAIKRAASGESGLCFASVLSAKGNGYFTLRDAEGKEMRGTPRGLFTKGTMLISVGQIVVAEGDPRKGVEIIAVIQEKSQAEDLVARGSMSATVLAAAAGSGAAHVPVAEDDLFEAPEEEEGAVKQEVRGGVVAQRKMAEALRSVASLAARLGGKKSSTTKLVIEGAGEDISAAAEAEARREEAEEDIEGDLFGRRPRKRSTSPSAGMSIPMRPAVADKPAAPSVWDTVVSSEAEEAAFCRSVAAAHPVRLAPMSVKSWEDEINVDDI